MLNRCQFILVILGLLLLNSYKVSAQSQGIPEEELIKKATAYFADKDYVKAFPLYSQVVSNHPGNALFNYCMGVCIIKAGSDKSEAIRFLTKATASPQNPVDCWYYLALALHADARYEDAMGALETFRLNSTKNVWNTARCEDLLTMCKNGIQSRNDFSMHHHRVTGKVEVSRNEFFKHYQNLSEAGRFLRLPKDYEEKSTRGSDETTMLFLSNKGDMMVFANKGKQKETGYDLFKVTKDAKGLWKFPEPITSLNTEFDEAFPVFTNDGNTIYFSSNGLKSIGGYDIFKSDYDPSTGRWSEPVSLGPPVNSPANDFFYIPATDKKSAYFSSDREAAPGYCTVYKSSVLDANRTFITVDGLFDTQADLELSDATITILNSEDRIEITQFTVPAQKGAFTLRVPADEKVIYRIEVPGIPVQETLVDYSQLTSARSTQELLIDKEQKLHAGFKNENAALPENQIVTIAGKNEVKTNIVAADTSPVRETIAPALNEVAEAQKETNSIDKETNQTKSETAEITLPVENQIDMAPESSVTISDGNIIVPSEETTANDQSSKRKNKLFSKKPKRYFPDDNYVKVPAENTPDPVALPAEPVAAIPVAPAEDRKATLETVVFRVQLGAFKKRSMEDLKRQYDKVGLTNLLYVRNDDNLLLVMTGSEKTYKAAVELREKIKNSGVADAFIVAYSEGERMPVALFETGEE